MNKRIYYNLTRLENGWLLHRPVIKPANDSTHLIWEGRSTEEFYPTLAEALIAIGKNWEMAKKLI